MAYVPGDKVMDGIQKEVNGYNAKYGNQIFEPGKGGGSGDAFRHAYAAARVAQNVSLGVGLGAIYEYMTPHETDGKPQDRFMDFWNNSFGANVGEKYKRLVELGEE